jgi:hypothetical protein
MPGARGRPPTCPSARRIDRYGAFFVIILFFVSFRHPRASGRTAGSFIDEPPFGRRAEGPRFSFKAENKNTWITGTSPVMTK